MPIDIFTGTAGVSVPASVSSAIITGAASTSAVMQLATQQALPGNGTNVHAITGNPVASIVGETDLKPVSSAGLASKLLKPYTFSVILPFSNQFLQNASGLYDALVSKLPEAIAEKFDRVALGVDTAPADFDSLAGATAVPFAGKVFKAAVAADAAVATAGGELNGWILAPQGRALVLGASDTTDRPLFTEIDSLLGQPIVKSKGAFKAGTPAQVGVAGDWTNAVWGAVGDIQISKNEYGVLEDGEETINLWQRNMFAIRAEVQLAFRVADVNKFVRLTSANQA